jgi:hypothetical protein
MTTSGGRRPLARSPGWGAGSVTVRICRILGPVRSLA